MAAHRRVSEASRVVARVAWHSGARLEAESRYRAALESAEAADGPAAESVATLACALGAAAKARGRAEEAEACFVHALYADETEAQALYADETEARIRIAPGGVGSEGARGRLKVGRFRHPRSAYHLLALAEVGRGKKRYAQAEVFYLAALDALETEGRGAHPTAPFEPATRDLLGVAERELGPLAASDAPSAGSAALGAPAEAPALGAPTSSSAASISQPPARAASTSAGRDAHGSSGLPEIALSVVAIGEFAVELLGVRRSGSEAEDAEPRGGGTRCSRQESARALAARHPGRRARDRLCSPPFANRSSAFSRREKKIRDTRLRVETTPMEKAFSETPRT